MLVYPGQQAGVDGVVPSTRLKWIRDGVDDYEYVEILKNLGLRDWALNISKDAGKDWHNWTRNQSVIENVRKQLGNKIEEMYNPPQSVCSNTICESGENCSTCPTDCGACPSTGRDNNGGSSGGGGSLTTKKMRQIKQQAARAIQVLLPGVAA